MKNFLKNRTLLVVAAVCIGAIAGSCLTPAGSVGQDRTYFACAGIGGVIDPTSLRIDSQPPCESGKTLQQWTQHADTSDLVGVTVERTGLNNNVGQWNSYDVTSSGTETALNCGVDCSAIAVRGTPFTLSVVFDPNTTRLRWTGCDNEPNFPDIGQQPYESTFCTMNGTHGANVVVDYSPL